jgi:hypothetical protein
LTRSSERYSVTDANGTRQMAGMRRAMLRKATLATLLSLGAALLFSACGTKENNIETPPDPCANGKRDGLESDIDCGGECARLCDVGQVCNGYDDWCTTGLCSSSTSKCVAVGCSDHRMNGDETDVDCGGPSCSACMPGQGCKLAKDCTTGVCIDGKCQQATCNDGMKNGSETGVDCGGDCPGKCANGLPCGEPKDCQSGICTGGLCEPASCSDGVVNGTETGKDCGGECATKCPNGDPCKTGQDCASKVCQGDMCQAPACTDGVKNGTETGTDCGGSCPGKCNDGEACELPEDCKSKVCVGKVCVAPQCADGQKNGTETDVDCGGADPSCNRCENLKACNGSADCVAPLSCEGNVCVCKTKDDCPGTDTLCGYRTCVAGACGMTHVPNGEVTGPNQCVRYVCDGAGNLQESNQPIGTACTQSDGTACDGNGGCGKFAIFDNPNTPFDNSMFSP